MLIDGLVCQTGHAMHGNDIIDVAARNRRDRSRRQTGVMPGRNSAAKPAGRSDWGTASNRKLYDLPAGSEFSIAAISKIVGYT